MKIAKLASLSLFLFLPPIHNTVLAQNTQTNPANDPFAPLTIYDGTWTVRADHPWGGGPAGTVDRLVSHCERFNRYFACEQSVNGETQSLLIYTATGALGKLACRTIAPDGLAGARGDLTLDSNHWTYFDKPPFSLKGNWSRVENFAQDHNHIRFEEYESQDEGRTWSKTNSGIEERLQVPGAKK